MSGIRETPQEPSSARRFIESFQAKTPRGVMALTLFKAWVKADPTSIVSEYPASYLANFVDMADAALASQDGEMP